MKLRSQSLTALQALLDLCVHSAAQVPTPLAEIARRQHLSAAFLEQLFRRLKAAGLVSPSRGMKGGYVLTRPAAEITVLDVFRALGDPLVLLSQSPSRRPEMAILLAAMEDVSSKLEDALASKNLEDLKQSALKDPSLQNLPKAGAGFFI
jgi:Rrf2 family protein